MESTANVIRENLNKCVLNYINVGADFEKSVNSVEKWIKTIANASGFKLPFDPVERLIQFIENCNDSGVVRELNTRSGWICFHYHAHRCGNKPWCNAKQHIEYDIDSYKNYQMFFIYADSYLCKYNGEKSILEYLCEKDSGCSPNIISRNTSRIVIDINNIDNVITAKTAQLETLNKEIEEAEAKKKSDIDYWMRTVADLGASKYKLDSEVAEREKRLAELDAKIAAGIAEEKSLTERCALLDNHHKKKEKELLQLISEIKYADIVKTKNDKQGPQPDAIEESLDDSPKN